MVNLDEIKADLKIDYPCNWGYTVIVDKGCEIEKIAKDIGADFRIEHSKDTAKYSSYKLFCLVSSEHERLEIFSLLKKHAKFVL